MGKMVYELGHRIDSFPAGRAPWRDHALTTRAMDGFSSKNVLKSWRLISV